MHAPYTYHFSCSWSTCSSWERALRGVFCGHSVSDWIDSCWLLFCLCAERTFQYFFYQIRFHFPPSTCSSIVQLHGWKYCAQFTHIKFCPVTCDTYRYCFSSEKNWNKYNSKWGHAGLLIDKNFCSPHEKQTNNHEFSQTLGQQRICLLAAKRFLAAVDIICI